MKIKMKLSILLLAVLVTLIGFEVMASPDVVKMISTGKEAGLHIISNHLAMQDKAADILYLH